MSKDRVMAVADSEACGQRADSSDRVTVRLCRSMERRTAIVYMRELFGRH